MGYNSLVFENINIYMSAHASWGASLQDGLSLLSALKAEGMPEAIVCIQGLMQGFDYSSGMGGGGSVSRQADLKRDVQVAVEAVLGSAVKCIQEENSAILIRSISVCIPRDISWRTSRSYVLSDNVEMLAPADPTQLTRSIKVSGYLRGSPMHLHSLMYVAGVGACRVVSVETATSPYDIARKKEAISNGPEIVYVDSSK